MAGGGGGAWKVAYADFVTAMMALFMVLWISSQDKKILLATSQYFRSPFNSPMTDHSGIMPFNKDSNDSSAPKSSDDTTAGKKGQNDKQVELNFLNSVAADFYRLLRLDENTDQKPIDIQVTSDGLRLTLFDRAKHPLFSGDTIEFSPWGRFILQNLAWAIERHKFRVTIDGHTRQMPPSAREDYSAWELSADRANAARRALVHFAVAPEQIERVTGYADTRPVEGEPPTSESNQRITLSLSLSPKSKDASRKAGPEPTVPTPVPAKPASVAQAPRSP